MNFSLLPPVLYARLNGALSRARGRIRAAEVVAEQVRADAREKASRCDERLGLEILEDYLAAAQRHVQEQREQAACELFSELIALRLAAGDIPPDAGDHALVVAACQKFGDNWRSHPVEICHELARLNAKFPKSIDERFSSWQELADALEGDKNKPTREKLVQYLRYRLKWQHAQVSLP